MKAKITILITLFVLSTSANPINRIGEILKSGNGNNFKTAFIVYNIDEEHSTINYLQKKVDSQMLLIYNNEIYDVFKDPKTGKSIYFKIIQQPIIIKKEEICL